MNLLLCFELNNVIMLIRNILCNHSLKLFPFILTGLLQWITVAKITLYQLNEYANYSPSLSHIKIIHTIYRIFETARCLGSYSWCSINKETFISTSGMNMAFWWGSMYFCNPDSYLCWFTHNHGIDLGYKKSYKIRNYTYSSAWYWFFCFCP